jgi:hypothetical protein
MIRSLALGEPEIFAMADARGSATGACMCGAVRFEVELPVTYCAHCHCTMCQRSHGAAFVTWIVVPNARFAISVGEAALVRFASSDHGTRSFCGTCGSTLFCESTHNPDDIDIVLANMIDSVELAPQLHAYFDDRASWLHVDDGLPRLGGESGMEPLKPDVN